MKAILITDMPSSCAECQFCGRGGRNLERYVCCLTGEHSEEPHLVGCPLQPLNKILKVGDRQLMIYEAKWLFNNLEREFELLKKVKEYL